MIIILLLIDFILLGIAYCMNPKNAKYLLSGYNTMSDKERDSFDIINYLKFMKSFFIKISIYSTMLFVTNYMVKKQQPLFGLYHLLYHGHIL